MARKDKLLDILSMAQLSTDVKIARLANRQIGRPLPREQAKAIVKCYLEGEGKVPDLTNRLINEKARQEGLRNGRRAMTDARAIWERSPIDKYRTDLRARKARVMEIAQRTFGQAIKENFNEDSLALMSLISGENRSYRIKWLDASFKPVRCCLIEVVTRGRVNPCQTNTIRSRWLLYKVGGRVLVLRAARWADDCMDAWSRAVPARLVEAAPGLKESGCRIESDLEEQEMVIFDPDGNEAKRVPWEGRTVD